MLGAGVLASLSEDLMQGRAWQKGVGQIERFHRGTLCLTVHNFVQNLYKS